MKYTVLLLRPDYIADAFGQDTYLAHVEAVDPEEAVEVAQREASDADSDKGFEDLDDYYPLITLIGHHEDLTLR